MIIYGTSAVGSTSGWLSGTSSTVAITLAETTKPYLVWFIQHLNNNTDLLSASTAVQCNGVNMTRLASATVQGGAHRVYAYGLANPTSGNVVVTLSSSQSYWYAGGSLFYGVQSTGQADSSNTGSSTGSSLTISTTTVANNAWVVGYFQNSSADTNSRTNVTSRIYNTGMGGDLFDSNGPINPAGLFLATESGSYGSSNWEGIIVSLVPVVTFNPSPLMDMQLMSGGIM